MKTTHLLAALLATALPLTAIVAEDSGKTETTEQKQVMSNWKAQDGELEKLVTEMNSAPADKKLDAVAAVLSKLVEQRKAMHEQMQGRMTGNEKPAMAMCRMNQRSGCPCSE